MIGDTIAVTVDKARLGYREAPEMVVEADAILWIVVLLIEEVHTEEVLDTCHERFWANGGRVTRVIAKAGKERRDLKTGPEHRAVGEVFERGELDRHLEVAETSFLDIPRTGEESVVDPFEDERN